VIPLRLVTGVVRRVVVSDASLGFSSAVSFGGAVERRVTTRFVGLLRAERRGVGLFEGFVTVERLGDDDRFRAAGAAGGLFSPGVGVGSRSLAAVATLSGSAEGFEVATGWSMTGMGTSRASR
jgi:hypothetical protein